MPGGRLIAHVPAWPTAPRSPADLARSRAKSARSTSSRGLSPLTPPVSHQLMRRAGPGLPACRTSW